MDKLKKLKAEVAKIEATLASPSKTKRKKRPARQPAPPLPSLGPPVGQGATSRTPRRQAGRRANGEFCLSRREYLGALEINNTSQNPVSLGRTLVYIHPDSFAWLKGLAKSFDQHYFTRVKVEYKPAVAMTTGGTVTLGADWSNRTSDTPEKKDVLALTPMVDGAVWQRMTLNLNPLKFASKRYYDNHAPSATATATDDILGTLVAVVQAGDPIKAKESKFFGDLLVDYEVVFLGTKGN